MELCEGGSVQYLLEQPENYHGLPDEELFLVFKHIDKALRCLFTNGRIHGDIRCDHILLHLAPDGRHTYKLTDFSRSQRVANKQQEGAGDSKSPKARPIPEYICSAEKKDLMDFASVLRLAVHGLVPKDQAIDSGYNSTSIFNVGDSNLTSPMRSTITEFMSQLKNIYTVQDRDTFFRELDLFMQRMPVHVFCVDMRLALVLYIKPDCNLQGVKQSLTELTNIKPEHQLLMSAESLLDGCVSEDRIQIQLRKTSSTHPFYMIYNLSGDLPPSKPKFGLDELLLKDTNIYGDEQWIANTLDMIFKRCRFAWCLSSVYQHSLVMQKRLCEIIQAKYQQQGTIFNAITSIPDVSEHHGITVRLSTVSRCLRSTTDHIARNNDEKCLSSGDAFQPFDRALQITKSGSNIIKRKHLSDYCRRQDMNLKRAKNFIPKIMEFEKNLAIQVKMLKILNGTKREIDDYLRLSRDDAPRNDERYSGVSEPTTALILELPAEYLEQLSIEQLSSDTVE